VYSALETAVHPVVAVSVQTSVVPETVYVKYFFLHQEQLPLDLVVVEEVAEPL
jgi:hypothetical protein